MQNIQLQGMQFLMWVVLFYAIVWCIVQYVTKKTRKPPPYFRKKTLIHEREQVLFHLLKEAMPHCHVMTQVRLADIVEVKECENKKNWNNWFKKISQKSVDFVICNKRFFVLACIELDGVTHFQAKRIFADGEKDLALKTAGIPIIRIKANKIPQAKELRKLIDDAFLHRTPSK